MSLLLALALQAAPAATPPPKPRISLRVVAAAPEAGVLRPVLPLGEARGWVRGGDYPATAISEGRTGEALVTIAVSATGATQGCAVTSVTGGADFGEVACALLTRYGRFRHALGEDGQPRAGAIAIRLFFDLGPAPTDRAAPRAGDRPATPAGPLDPLDLVIRDQSEAVIANLTPAATLAINARGEVTDCRITSSAGTDAGDLLLCARLRRVRFTPARDAQGRAIATRYDATVSVQR